MHDLFSKIKITSDFSATKEVIALAIPSRVVVCVTGTFYKVQKRALSKWWV